MERRLSRAMGCLGPSVVLMLTAALGGPLVYGCLALPDLSDGAARDTEAPRQPSDEAPFIRDAGVDGALADSTFVLVDGGVVRGPVVAEYDHRTFWDASSERTYAVFDRERFADYPDDRSLRFVSSLSLVAPVTPQPNLPDPRYREFLREKNIVLFRSPLEGVSFVIRGNDGYHLEENGYGHFAWDLVKTKEDGTRARGAGTVNEDYETWDAPVFLPSAGVVVELERNGVDNPPGSYPPDAVNNMVGVFLGGHYYVYLLHFRKGTIPSPTDGTCAPVVPGVRCVTVGAWLPAGTYLGRAGNAGVSLEPHVHVTLLYYDVDPSPPHAPSSPRTWSIPGEFSELYTSSTPRGPSTLRAYAVPRTGEYVSDRPF